MSNTGKEHPQLYGDWNIGNLPISQFIGYQHRDTPSSTPMKIKLTSDASTDHLTFDKDAIIAVDEVPVGKNVNQRLT